MALLARFSKIIVLFAISLNLYSSNKPKKPKKPNIFTRFQQECSLNANYLKKYINNNIATHCSNNYHHYNSKASQINYHLKNSMRNPQIKIGTWNVLKPGNRNSYFKDYRLMADYIEKFHLISLTELIPNSRPDFTHNLGLYELMKNSQKTIKQIKSSKTLSSKRKNSLIARVQKESTFVKEHISQLYKIPGYLKLLNELNRRTRKKYWSLIISSVPDGNLKSEGSMELVGVIYDSRYAKPITQSYCQKVKRERANQAFGCYVDFTLPLFNKNFSQFVQRRPFLAAFESGSLRFNLLSSHISFQETGTEADRRKFFEVILGDLSERNKIPFYDTVKNLKKVKRTGEIYLTLQAIRKLVDLSPTHQKAFIWAGDWNFEKSDPFWQLPGVLKRNEVILIDAPTSLKQARIIRNRKIPIYKDPNKAALSSNYDHFYLNDGNKLNRKCHTPKVFDFTHYYDFAQMPFAHEYETDDDLIDRFVDNYVFHEAPIKRKPLQLTRVQNNKVNLVLKHYEADLSRHYSIKKTQVKISENKKIPRYYLFNNLHNFKKNFLDELKNIFATQFDQNNNMRIYLKFLSDHLPVMMTCETD